MGTYTDLLKLKPRLFGKEERTVIVESSSSSPSPEPNEVSPTNLPDIGQSGMTESPTDRLPECLNARTQALCVQQAIATRATKKESYRFPEELIEVLDDIPHQIKKAHKKRVSKTTIFVAALAAYLWDYQQNGGESQLYKQLIEQAR